MIIQCNLSCNLIHNFVKGSVTSALHETLCQVVYRVRDKILAEQFRLKVAIAMQLLIFFPRNIFCESGQGPILAVVLNYFCGKITEIRAMVSRPLCPGFSN